MLLMMVQAATVFGLSFNVALNSLTNHNTSANPAYNEANFAANFGTTTWISQSGATMAVDPTKMDESLNPITPGHVSKTDVHTLVPSRPDLRWFAHATPWFGTSSHINIGLTNNTTTYVAAMITDMKNRGFNGVVIDWYGQNDSTDGVTQKIKSYLAGLTNNTFTYIVMVDKGVQGGLGTNNLQAQIQYCQNQYFGDPNYEHEPLTTGLPILMFFGVRSVLGQTAMAGVKAYLGGQMVWVEEGTGYLSESWEDECFEWTDEFDTGVNPNDPFNLDALTSDYPTIKNSGKKAFGAMCAKFNGTLTKSVSWSMGKYLPCSNGLCLVERAASINSAIPSSMTRMQWPTWSDWEEGTQVESGIDNYLALISQVNTANVFWWTIVGGDERTVDHYELYASTNGVTAAFLGSVPTGVYQTNLTKTALLPGSYQLYVDAVGKPCIRDHMSQPISCIYSMAPSVAQPPTSQTVSYGQTATFSVSATGSPPLSYTWYDQNNNVVSATSNLVITSATQGNSYSVVVANQYGSVSNAPAVLTVVTAPLVQTDVQPLSQIVWQGDPVSFAVQAGGMPPLSYQWTLNGQNIPGATNPAYSFPALTGTNDYQVTISNAQGSVNSSTGVVAGVAATFLNPSNYMGMQITFTGYTNAVSVTNFPVLVRLSTNIPGFSYSQFVSPSTGADLRFASATGRELPFQIDEWNPAGQSEVWVQVSSISTTNDYITACWGNAADSAMLPCNTNGAPWTTLSGSNNFQLVYHLSQSGFPFADSTLRYPDSQGVAPTSTTGEIGKGCLFNGTTDYLSPGSISLGSDFTFSTWANMDPTATNIQTLCANKAGGSDSAGFALYINNWNTANQALVLETGDGVQGLTASTAPETVSPGVWHHIACVVDGTGGTADFYVDGTDCTVTNSVLPTFVNQAGFNLGRFTNSYYYFKGGMDEARIENGVRSPAWIWASWATVADSAFATYGTIAPPAVTLQYQRISGQPVLTWASGILQSAPIPTGPFTNVTAATSPYPLATSSTQQYFRVKVQ
jgi:hypothetical protein